jgi:hypothetical protein
MSQSHCHKCSRSQPNRATFRRAFPFLSFPPSTAQLRPLPPMNEQLTSQCFVLGSEDRQLYRCCDAVAAAVHGHGRVLTLVVHATPWKTEAMTTEASASDQDKTNEKKMARACVFAACAPLSRSKPLKSKKWDFIRCTHALIKMSDLLCRQLGLECELLGKAPP